MNIEKFNVEKSYVKQHNAITSGRYEYTKCMLDILFMTLAMINVDKPKERTFQIYQKDIEAITGRSWDYSNLMKATEGIGSRMFEVETADELTQIWLFSSVRYLKGQGCFIVKINEEAMPYFFELKNNFTMIHLRSVLSCSSKFAKRIYALACQWRSIGYHEFDIDDFKKMLGLVNDKDELQYTRLSDFRKNVIKTAVEQINENTDINISIELSKRGRSFKIVKLSVANKPSTEMIDINFNKSIEENIIEVAQLNLKKAIMTYGISEKFADILSKKVSQNEFEKETQALNKKIVAEKNIDAWTTERIAKYLVGVFQKKGVLPRKV